MSGVWPEGEEKYVKLEEERLVESGERGERGVVEELAEMYELSG